MENSKTDMQIRRAEKKTVSLNATSKNSFLIEWKKNKIMFFMLMPAILYFIIFQYLPMGGLLLAFKKFDYAKGIFGSPWIGFDNFQFLFTSGALYRITRNTILYNLMFLVVTMTFQVCVAIILSEIQGKYFKKTVQSILFLPYFVSFVLLGAFVYNIFNFEFGILNTFLKSVGFQPVDIYSNPSIWKYILQAFHTWKWVGYGSVIYLSAIVGIDQECFESAKIDGANLFQQIRHITIPLITPTIIITIMFNIGSILKGQFELFYQLIGDNSTLFEATDVIDTYVFRSLARNFDIGMGSAASFYQAVFGVVLVFSVNYIVRKKHSDYALF